MRRSISAAGSSDGACGASLPCIASSMILDFIVGMHSFSDIVFFSNNVMRSNQLSTALIILVCY